MRAATAILVIAALGGLARGQESSRAQKLKVGMPVPAFELETLDAKKVSTADWTGKVVVVSFVRGDEPRSMKTLGVLDRIHRDRGVQTLAVVAVGSGPKAREPLVKSAGEMKLTIPVALDPERRAFGAWGVVALPTTFVIDTQGVLRFRIPSLPRDLRRRLDAHLDLLSGVIDADEHARRLTAGEVKKDDARQSRDRRLALARRLLDREKTHQAVGLLEKIYADAPSPEVAVLLGGTLLELGETEKAAKILDPLATAEDPNPDLLLALGRLERLRGNHQKAVIRLRRAHELRPADGAILYELGLSYEASGEVEKALACYRDALERIYRSREARSPPR